MLTRVWVFCGPTGARRLLKDAVAGVCGVSMAYLHDSCQPPACAWCCNSCCKLKETPACTHYESQLHSTRDCSALSVLRIACPCSKQTHCRLWSCCNPHVLPAFFTAGRFLRQFDFPAFPDFPSFPSFPSIPTVTTTTPGGGTVTTGTFTSGPGASASSSSSTGGSGGSVMQTSTSQGGSKPVTTTTGRCACSIVSDTLPSVVSSVNDNAF